MTQPTVGQNKMIRGKLYCPCGNEINVHTSYRLVTGWERIHRPGGGTNAIRAPERHEEYRCLNCVDKLVNNINPGQMALV